VHIHQPSSPAITYPLDANIYGIDVDGLEARFDALENELHNLYRHVPFGLFTLDVTGTFLTVNTQMLTWLGYVAEELIGLKKFAELLSLDSKKIYQAYLPNHFHIGYIGDIELELIARNGSIRHVSLYSNAIFKYDGALAKHRSVLFSIDERKEMEARLNIAATVFETQEGIIVTDAHQIILSVNKAFSNITGYSAEDVLGLNPRILSSGRHDAEFYATMWSSINSTGRWSGEIWNRRKTGEVYPEFLTVNAVNNQDGVLTNYVATLTDITNINLAVEEIKNLAFYDALTELPNRRLFADRLKNGMFLGSRTGFHGAIMFIDLDYFKTLNDTLGHDVGDLLLRQVAERLSACVREGDTVARLGGDEFVVLLLGLSTEITEAASQILVIGEKIIASLNKLYHLETLEYHITASIGVALFKGQELSKEQLLKQADIAMYQSKTTGRNTLTFFDTKMQEVITERVNLEKELRQALELNEFQLFYQVQVDHMGQSIGAEALIRWRHPKRGIVGPFDFITVAEESGLIIPMGLWVLETACAQLKAWEQDALTSHLKLSVNVSVKEISSKNFATEVITIVKQHGINTKLLRLELTESMLINNIEQIILTMNELKEIGIHFELDDFGTGYSSLQYLKKLPLIQLKIDQSFVRDVLTDVSDRVIVRTIIAMARSLNLDVIAEGVETKEQQQILLKKGCKHYQGYLFGKPVPIDKFNYFMSDIWGIIPAHTGDRSVAKPVIAKVTAKKHATQDADWEEF
jgi:diguanylate cyclase (GGDEF)-like protein/PAS domain S-box-containing protein